MGASILINYNKTPDWDVAVMASTDGRGASHILELGGPDIYDSSIRSVTSSGKIIQIGVRSGFGPAPNLTRLQTENADIIGVTVGSVEHFKTIATATYGGRFGDKAYAAEELIAELGAAFVCADLALAPEPRPDHAAYVASWPKVLRGDKRAIFTAAAKAQAAADGMHAQQEAAARRRL